MAQQSTLPQRHSIRLKTYDYSQQGLYFVTICTQDRKELFGDIAQGVLCDTPQREAITSWYYELQNKFPNVVCHSMMVMPNHIHFIVEITHKSPAISTNPVGADLCVRPNNRVRPNFDDRNKLSNNDVNDDLNDDFDNDRRDNSDDNGQTRSHDNNGQTHSIDGGQTHRSAPTVPPIGLGSIVQWFKTMTTNDYIRHVKTDNWQRFHQRLWQRNYWEHIIRNGDEYDRITRYINNNPMQWHKDPLGSDNNSLHETSATYNHESWMV